jgi:hypothetical protein
MLGQLLLQLWRDWSKSQTFGSCLSNNVKSPQSFHSVNYFLRLDILFGAQLSRITTSFYMFVWPRY